MDGQVDLKLIITLLGVAASVFGGAAVAKANIKQALDQIKDLESRVRDLDSRADRATTQIETQAQRVSILSGMASPENLRRDHMELARLISITEQNTADIDRLHSMHNGSHPSVKDST